MYRIMTKRLRTSSEKKQEYIYNATSIHEEDKFKGTPSNIYHQLTKRQTHGRQLYSSRPGNPILINNDGTQRNLSTIDFQFTGNQFKLKRYFCCNSSIYKLVEKLNKINKPIYEIYIHNNLLVFKQYFNIQYDVSNYNDQHLFESHLPEEELISANILGNIVDSSNNPDLKQDDIISNDIQFKHFLFKDENNNYYYINYDIYRKVFDLFYNIYKKRLVLELYPGFFIRNTEDIHEFINNFSDEHSSKYYFDASESESKSLSSTRSKGGGISKRILKKY